MEVRAKYQLLSKATISSISYNSQYNILAVNADSNDTATFFTLSHQLQFTSIFTAESRPPSTRCVAWSPNGRLIAVANTNVEIWKFDGLKMAPLAVFHQGYIEIKNLVWSPDSQSYLCYGVNPKDMPLAVHIRRLQNSELKRILIGDTAVMANFDPFGKYVMVQLLNNSLELFDARTLEKVKVINLAETKNDLPTKGDRRTADWSPQFSYFVCPNLNDARVPTAVILDRTRSFGIKDILIGHQSTISCCKFNPNIYQYNSDVTFILALGDSSGCLSLWRVGKYDTYDEPLFILSSPAKAEQSIEDVQWNSQGDILLVNVLKKYITVLQFQPNGFGKKMTDSAKSNLIVATYGASGANQIAGAQLEVFGQYQQSIQTPRQQKCVIETKFQGTQKPKQQLVKTTQQIIYSKDVNNKQKKRIIPSRLVPESQLPVPEVASQNVISQKLKFPTFKIPPIKSDVKRQYQLPNQQTLQVETSKDMYILSIKTKFSSNESENRIFNNQIKLISVTKQNILVVSNQKLFIFDHTLRLMDLPCCLGQICNFTSNNQGVIYYMLCNGLIRGFNYITHTFILETSAAYILMNHQQIQITSSPFSIFTVFDNDAEKLHVQLKDTLSRYFYCKESNSWVQFDFQNGFFMPGHSLKISKPDKQNADNFYMKLVAPAIWTSQKNKKDSTVDQFELQLIYYSKYAKSSEKFKQSLLKMLLDLKSKGNSAGLRKQITKYFMDKNSPDYLNDPQLWMRVKKIGGKVIEEFLMLRNEGE